MGNGVTFSTTGGLSQQVWTQQLVLLRWGLASGLAPLVCEVNAREKQSLVWYYSLFSKPKIIMHCVLLRSEDFVCFSVYRVFWFVVERPDCQCSVPGASASCIVSVLGVLCLQRDVDECGVFWLPWLVLCGSEYKCDMQVVWLSFLAQGVRSSSDTS